MARRSKLKIAMLCIAALSAISARAQEPGPEVVSSIYLCAGFTGTSLTSAQFAASRCATANGIVIKGKLSAYSFGAARSPGTIPLDVSAFQITRNVMDATGVNLTRAILDGVNLGTLVIGVNSADGMNEINQFTFVLKGARLQSAQQTVSSSGPEEAFALTFTGLSIHDNVAGTVVTYAAPTKDAAASTQGSLSFAGRVQ